MAALVSSSFWSASSKHSILVTGGASGIGLAFAIRFAQRGHEVIVCGRREAQLETAKATCPNLFSLVGDVETEEGRKSLVSRALTEFPNIDVLVNNAGIQNHLPPLTEQALNPDQFWAKHRSELAINVDAPIHLSLLFLESFSKKSSAQIINVTSGLAFTQKADVPTYCATKAALHSFTMSLRHQLRDTTVSVVEIAPPAVNTDLGGVGLHDLGENVDVFSDHVFAKLEEGQSEIGFKMSEAARNASRAETDLFFQRINGVH